MDVIFIGMMFKPIAQCFPHSHDVWEAVLYYEGSGVTQIGDRSYEFYPGKLFLIPPGCTHSETGNGLYKDINIMVRDFTWPEEDKVLEFNDDQDRRLYTLFWYAFTSCRESRSGTFAIANALWEAVYQLLRAWSADSGRHADVDLFKKKLFRNITNSDFDLAHEIDTCGYCKDYFRRLFKKVTGCTPLAYLTDLRIDYALDLLRLACGGGISAKGTIQNIAHMSGFSDACYFTRVFTGRVGMSPTRFLSDGRAEGGDGARSAAHGFLARQAMEMAEESDGDTDDFRIMYAAKD